jgi:tRNA splicing endonuclease
MSDYNGVRRDVVSYINANPLFSLKDRELLVNSAKGQQKILTIDGLCLTEQHKLALDSTEARYCSSQHISLKKIEFSRS